MSSTNTYSTFKPTYLYIKQHSITGLLYFGKTTKSDPYKYKGSGTYWKNHIKKYGTEHVKTLWIKLFDDKNSCVNYATNFSTKNNIVESHKWANQVIEDGLGNGTPGRICSEETKSKISKSNTGKKHSNETNQKKVLKGERNGMFNVRRFGVNSPHYNKPHTEESRKKMREAAKNRKKICCPYCQKNVDTANAKKYHFDKCKFNPNTTMELITCPHCNIKSPNKGNMNRYHFDKCKSYFSLSK